MKSNVRWPRVHGEAVVERLGRAGSGETCGSDGGYVMAQVIFVDVYLIYKDEPDKVR